jgi:hypothetical protein
MVIALQDEDSDDLNWLASLLPATTQGGELVINLTRLLHQKLQSTLGIDEKPLNWT